jgi:hypothetical protein
MIQGRLGVASWKRAAVIACILGGTWLALSTMDRWPKWNPLLLLLLGVCLFVGLLAALGLVLGLPIDWWTVGGWRELRDARGTPTSGADDGRPESGDDSDEL